MARIRRTTIAMVLVGVCAALALASDVRATELALYDDFSGPEISPDKWGGFEGFTGSFDPNTEAKRFIQFGKLHVDLTTYGGVASSSNGLVGRFGLVVANPAPITAIEASVTVKRASFQDCADNPTPSRAIARIIGAFFNDGSSTGPSDRTGNILAGIQKHLDLNGNHFVAFVDRCPDAGCPTSTTLSSFAFTTTWTPGRADTLRLEWDPTVNRFLFTLNAGTSREESTGLTYTVSDSLPPVINFKQLVVQNRGANCLSGRMKVVMEALFDNVKLNPEAVP